MDFELNEDQQIFQKTVRKFAQEEITPHSSQWDREETFPYEAVKKAAAIGLMGITISDEYGGAGADYISVALALEEIARADGSFALTVASHNGLCSSHINLFGNKRQKEKYLPDLASGKKLGAWGLTEPGSGSDASGVKTTAVKKGDIYIINGSKMFITQGTVGEVFVVLASTDKEKKQRGISAFILDKGMKGFSQRSIHGKLGMRSSDTAELIMEEVEVPEENMVGEKDWGFIDTLQILDRGRIAIASLGVGIIRGSLEESIKYATQRKQFGQPIAKFQAIENMIAEMSCQYEAARNLTWQSAYMMAYDIPIRHYSSMAKLYSAQAAMRSASNAIQIHGGYGYTSEFPVERYYRDAKLLEIGEGTNEIQKMVIARHILKN